jgi:hypothetical protein
MNARQALLGLLLTAVNLVAAACEVPKLIALPPAGGVGDDSGRWIAEMQGYVSGIRDYSACVRAELAAAGGDSAHESLRDVLISRNNAAVAEGRAVIALFEERVAPIEELYLAEFLAGGGQTCIDQLRLERLGVIDDLSVLFIDRSGQTYLNVLERTCTDLARFGHFDIRSTMVGDRSPGPGPAMVGGRIVELGAVRTMRLCSDEFIVPYAFETQTLRNRECALGRFFELSQEQTARLLELRNARQAAADPAQDLEAETPGRQRSER